MQRPAFFALILWSVLAVRSSFAVAVPPRPASVDHERLEILGWNKGCSVAVSHLAYPKLGEAIQQDPIRTRLGALTIRPGRESADVHWFLALDGPRSWNAFLADDALASIKKEGYTQPGFHESIRPEPVVDRDLPRLLLTTATFRTKSPDIPEAFPGRFRLANVHYSPVTATCGLLVFEDIQAAKDKPFFDFRLVRIGNTRIRAERALAHLTNGLLLLERGDRPSALAETAIAAEMAPDDGAARYYHATMLAINGQADAALDELEAAARLDPRFKKKALQDINFEDLSWMPRFKEITR